MLGLEKTIGNFVVGKSFDALVIDPYANDSPLDIFNHDSFMDTFQKFIFLGIYRNKFLLTLFLEGNDKNIESIFVNGKKLK